MVGHHFLFGSSGSSPYFPGSIVFSCGTKMLLRNWLSVYWWKDGSEDLLGIGKLPFGRAFNRGVALCNAALD